MESESEMYAKGKKIKAKRMGDGHGYRTKIKTPNSHLKGLSNKMALAAKGMNRYTSLQW
jgi:hypothetical protein